MNNNEENLFNAIKKQQYKSVIDMLNNGFNINAKNRDGNNVLHHLLFNPTYDNNQYNSYYSIIESLIIHNVNINATNIYGQNVLDTAIQAYYVYECHTINDHLQQNFCRKIVELLINNGANYDKHIKKLLNNRSHNIISIMYIEKIEKEKQQLQDKIKLLQKENESLKLHISYAPGGDGFLAAQNEFEALNSNNTSISTTY